MEDSSLPHCKCLLLKMIAFLPYLALFWHSDFLFSPLPFCPCWDSLQDRQACRPIAAVLQMSCVSKTLTFQPPASALYRWFCHKATLNIPLKSHISSLCQVFHQLQINPDPVPMVLIEVPVLSLHEVWNALVTPKELHHVLRTWRRKWSGVKLFCKAIKAFVPVVCTWLIIFWIMM